MEKRTFLDFISQKKSTQSNERNQVRLQCSTPNSNLEKNIGQTISDMKTNNPFANKKNRQMSNTLVSFSQFQKRLERQGLPIFEIKLKQRAEQMIHSEQSWGKSSLQYNKFRNQSQNASMKNSEIAELSQILAKKASTIISSVKRNMFKTHYAKINRKKQFLQKRIKIETFTPSEQGNMMTKPMMLNHESQQKLFQRYQELKNTPTAQSINMLNELYEEKLITTKGALIGHKKINNQFKKAEISIKQANKVIRSQSKTSDKKSKSQSNVFFQSKIIATPKVMVHQNKADLLQKNYDSRSSHREDQKESKNKRNQNEGRNKQKINQIKSNNDSIIEISPQKNTAPPPKKVTAQSLIVYECFDKKYFQENDTSPSKFKQYFNQKIHLSVNHKSSVQIASLTKIMTCIITIQACERYKLNIKDCSYKIGRFQSKINGTSAEIQSGEIYTIQQLLYGLMLPSGNDASLALAVWTGRLLLERQALQKYEINSKKIPSKCISDPEFSKNSLKLPVEKFLAEMNKKSRVLKMQKTTYANSHGLVNSLNKSSCLDLAILCEYAMENKEFKKIVSSKQYSGMIQKQQKIQIIQESIANLSLNQNEGNSVNNKKEDLKMVEPNFKISKVHEDDLETYDDIEHEDNDFQSEESEEELSKNNFQNQKDVNLRKYRIETSTHPIQWTNTHKLIHKHPEYIGIKTGITTAAGPCLSSYLTAPNGRRFIIIVLNCKRINQRFKDTEILKKWLFKKQKINCRKHSSGEDSEQET